MDTILKSVLRVEGSLLSPCSKSYAQRAIILSILSKRIIELTSIDICGDISSALNIASDLGCAVNYSAENRIAKIDATNSTLTSKEIFVGESGFLARQFIPLSTIFELPVNICGKGSILTRSFKADLDKLTTLGVKHNSNNNKLPVEISSTVSNNSVKIDCSDGSQFLSGLLSVGAFLDNGIEIEVKNLTSEKYVDITIEILNSFGIDVTRDGYKLFKIAKQQINCSGEINIEGDYSSASCMLVAGAICGNSLKIDNLKKESHQPDSAIVKLLQTMGANIKHTGTQIEISRSKLSPFEFDATSCPDLFPALVALAANISGESRITGANRLLNKESNRAEALQKEFAKIGVNIVVDNDLMKINGGKIIGDCEVDSHNDHRIAMTLAIASLTSENPITIKNIGCVEKSYPMFWQDLKSISR